jgi:Leucine-rich repeat (LRR) protein
VQVVAMRLYTTAAYRHMNAPLRDDALLALRGAASAPFMHFLRRVADCARTRELALRGGAWGEAGGGLELRLGVVAAELTGRAGCKLLDLRDNDIRELPSAVRRMTALTALLLDRNRLRYVPAELGDVTTLQVLSAAGNEVAELPDALAGLGRLTDLDLSRNRLARLPPSLAACTALTRLAVADNALAALPAGLDRLRRLRYVHVGGNPLARLPPELGASPLLVEATADRCPALAACGPDVALAAVPPRNPAPRLDPGPSRLLCNPQRLAALLAEPALAAELAGHDVRRVLAAPPPPSSLLRAVVQSHCEMTAGTRTEELCRAERRNVVFDEGPLLYGRTWRLGKAAQLRGADAAAVNQAAAAAMPQTGRAPALVRFLWGVWAGHRLAVMDVSGTGLRRVPEAVLEVSWVTKLGLAYNRLTGLPAALTSLTQLTVLDVSHNLLAALPAALGDVTTLRELSAAFNMLAALPKEMARLEHWVYPRDARARHVYDTAWIAGNPIAFPHLQARPPSLPASIVSWR